MQKYYNHINLLILPTDACNMNCIYCFHKPYSHNFEKISIKTLEHLLTITAPNYKRINIIWHGGEPMLMGIDFFKEALQLQKNYSCQITNSIQSNLTLLTPQFADFLVNNNISVSGSFDGVCNEQLRGHSEEILLGRQLIIDRGKSCGLIMVVSGRNIDNLIDSYEFFKKQGINFSLNLYLEQKECQVPELQLYEKHTIMRLCELFDYWTTDTTGNIHISYFKNILDYLLFNKKTLCSYTSCLGRWLGVHYDGTVGPCNRYFPNEYGYGNITEYSDISDVFKSDGFSNILCKAIERREKCKSCDIFGFCSGGCNNVALNENGIENNGGLSCKILLGVYKHIDAFVNNMNSCVIPSQSYNPLLLRLIKTSVQN